jgi:hypothetical protein
MANNQLNFGDRVQLIRGQWTGRGAIVSWPVTPESPGFALVCVDDRIAGIPIHLDDVTPALPETRGFTQLTYQLNRLSSFLIERTFL